MKRLLLFLILVTGASAQCYPPELGWGSWLAINSASGEIIGESQTVVTYDTSCITQADIIQDTAGVVGNLNGSYVTSATDNCGPGCATVYTYGQVGRLGETDTETGAHSGTLSYADGYFFDYETSGVSETIPSAPTVNLTSIDARSPHSVGWNYYVYGTCPNSLAWQLGSDYNINYGCPNGTFYSDQMSYPGGTNFANITSNMFGITTYHVSCFVDRYDNDSINQSYVYTVVNGQAQLIDATHIAADSVTTFDYCIPTIPGSLVTTFGVSAGSVDTTNNPSWQQHGIDMISENHNYNGYTDVLGPWLGNPPDGPTFKTRESNYYPVGTNWTYQGSPVSICNTVLWLSTTGSGNHQNVYVAGPLGCLYLPFP